MILLLLPNTHMHTHTCTHMHTHLLTCYNHKILVLKEELSKNDNEILRLQIYNDGLAKKLTEKVR